MFVLDNGFSIVLAAMLAATVKADFISSQVICSVKGGTVTGTNFCSIAGDFATLATASVDASFTLPTSPGPLSLVSSGQGFARGYYDGTNNNRTAFFSESVSIQLTLDTPGSPRSGFFLITGRSSPLAGYDTTYSESIFGYSVPSPGLALRELPITLGQPFTFTYTQSMSCFDGPAFNSICMNNTFSSQFDFHLYETDSHTSSHHPSGSGAFDRHPAITRPDSIGSICVARIGRGALWAQPIGNRPASTRI